MATSISQRFAKTGDYFLLEDADLRGSLRIVSSIADRDAIPLQSRKQGMVVRVIDADGFTDWELGYGKPISNTGWVESTIGGKKGNFIPIAGGPLEGEMAVSDLGSINFNDTLTMQAFDGNLQFTQKTKQNPDDFEPVGMVTFNDSVENTVEINPAIGQIVCKTEVAIASDRSLKDHITRIENSLAITRRMYGYTYELKSLPGVSRTGLIAQEVNQAMPQATMRMSDGKLAVLYGNLVGLLVENVHELEDMLKTLSTRLDALENKS